MSDYPMLISNKLHSFRNFSVQKYNFIFKNNSFLRIIFILSVENYHILLFYSYIYPKSLGLACILIFRRVDFVWVLMSNSREYFCTLIKNIHTKCGYFR